MKTFEPYYDLISEHYKGKRAKRSGVPYMNHIDEGLKILDYYWASWQVKAAYCIHPILQDDEGLNENLYLVLDRNISPVIMFLSMEYRNVANRGLSCYQVDNPEKVYLSPIISVNLMLKADKIQNRKDFLKYHYGTHPKSIELDIYFKNWLRALGVTEAEYNNVIKETGI